MLLRTDVFPPTLHSKLSLPSHPSLLDSSVVTGKAFPSPFFSLISWKLVWLWKELLSNEDCYAESTLYSLLRVILWLDWAACPNMDFHLLAPMAPTTVWNHDGSWNLAICAMCYRVTEGVGEWEGNKELECIMWTYQMCLCVWCHIVYKKTNKWVWPLCWDWGEKRWGCEIFLSVDCTVSP